MAEAVKEASGTFSKRIMHAIVENDGKMDFVLKSAETVQEVSMLVAAGADPKSFGGGNAVIEAVSRGHTAVLKELLVRGAEASTEALLAAVNKCDVECVAELIKHDADVTTQVAYVAASTGNIDILKQVLQVVGVEDDDDGLSVTAMYAAIKNDHVRIVDMLLEDYKVEVTPDLFIGASDEVVKRLVAYTDATYEVLLSVIVHNQASAACEMLKMRGQFTDKFAFGPALHAAIAVGNTDIIKALLDKGAHVTQDVMGAAFATDRHDIIQAVSNYDI